MSYLPLCVFLNSQKQERLSIHHPFYVLVEEVIQDIVKCPLILDYMAKTTLAFHNEDAEKQRVQEIIQYLQTNFPVVSGSDSPTMDLSFVETRMYLGCGKNPRNRRTVQQHIYIQRCLIDAWFNTYIKVGTPTEIHQCNLQRHHCFFFVVIIRLCLLRGFITVVKLAFSPENNNTKYQAQSLSHGPPCSFEHFLWEWKCWIVLTINTSFHNQWPTTGYDENFVGILIADQHAFCHVYITYKDHDNDDHNKYLHSLAGGDWTAFPPVVESDNYVTNHPSCIKLWDSPPGEGQDHIPQRIEMITWSQGTHQASNDEMVLACTDI